MINHSANLAEVRRKPLSCRKKTKMAQNPDATLRVYFGVELELVLTPKQDDTGNPWKDWLEAANAMSKLLKDDRIPNKVIVESSSYSPDYRLWNIAMDGTIGRADSTLQKWGVELVSSICLNTEPERSDWVRTQKTLWHCVERNFAIKPSETCGTHVHVSLPSLRALTKMRMRRVCKAVVYFERCIDSIMPPHRRNNKYCMSNRYNKSLERYQTMPEVFKAIDAMKTYTDLANLLSPDRFFRWNFQRIAKAEAETVILAKVATVEFRQPPGCTTVDDALFWQGFTLAFMGGAITSQSSIDPRRVPTMTDLARFVSAGRSKCQNVYSGGFDNFIQGKQKLKEGPIHEPAQPMVRDQDHNANLQEQKLDAAFAARP